MTNPYEMMFRSGVMSEYRRPSRWQERRMVNSALRHVQPVINDQTWILALMAAGLVIVNVILFVGWWVG